MTEAEKEALEVADKCRALTKPESALDYGASLSFKIDLMPHLATLAESLQKAWARIEELEFKLKDLERGWRR